MRPDLDLNLHFSHDLNEGHTKTSVYDYARNDYELSLVLNSHWSVIAVVKIRSR